MTQDCMNCISSRGKARKNERGAVSLLVVFLAGLVAVCVAAGVVGGTYLLNTYTQIKDVENAQDIVPKLPVTDTPAQQGSDQQEGTIDFDALQQGNPDIYAWIYIPDTHINYAVCQSAQSNDYYLSHAADGSSSEVGSIFSEAQFNHKDFEDRVTILYGHSGFASTMFSDLLSYEHQEFLDAHDRVYIYTPGHVRTYQVFSAFSAGDRHIMDAFDLTSAEGFSTFVTYLKSPDAIDAHVTDVEIGDSDKLLVLSTCGTGALQAQGRYLVCGVLIDDQPTD
jgi:sortase B